MKKKVARETHLLFILEPTLAPEFTDLNPFGVCVRAVLFQLADLLLSSA